jgi:hypothetical protein
VPPKTYYVAKYVKETTGDFFNFTVAYVVDADVTELKGNAPIRTKKLSEIVPSEAQRTFIVRGSVRNVLGGKVKPDSSDRPIKRSDESCKQGKPEVQINHSPNVKPD